MESPQRKPLATRSNTISRLPMPGSRLKRSRSPDPVEKVKKSKVETPQKGQATTVTKKSLRPSLSTSTLPRGGLNRPRNAVTEASKSRFRRANSSTNVQNDVGGFNFQQPTVKKPAVSSKVAQSAVSQKATVSRVKPTPSQTTVGRVPRSAVAGSRTVGPSVSKWKPAATSQLDTTTVTTGATKKRPAWDLKGRLEDMERAKLKEKQQTSMLQTQLSNYNSRLQQLENDKQQLSCENQAKQMASDSARQRIQQLEHEMQSSSQEFESVKRRLQSQVQDLEYDKSSLHRQKKALDGDLTAALQEVRGLKSSLADVTSSQAAVRAQLEHTKIQLESAQDQVSSLTVKVEQQTATIQRLEEMDRRHETERRKLHNQIQELKGNIRVFCRVRPLLGNELVANEGGAIHHINYPDLDGRVVELDKLSDSSANESALNGTRGGKSTSKYDFSFDKVFQPDATQADVFSEISQLVQSALDGYNVCIFAYGQTGSGKTHTMEGSLDSDDSLGMIPRAVTQIFHCAQELEQKGWKYQIKASMLEIYNETLKDLLGKGDNLEIKLDGKGDNSDVHVPGLTVVEVTHAEKVHQLLKESAANRSVAATLCNERSSRSHLVFQLQLKGDNCHTGQECKGTLSLVDLAGSERVKVSGSEGQRLKEAQKINKSLSDLGNVILALGEEKSHIPYRNSKLTYLLKNSLGGNSKTLMFVNISPREECFTESLNSLRFATKVNQTHIGTAHTKK